ncbi:MAG: undecaprenyl-phosphate alpha-N-acetylglucosaminyl 1-phosphate transferase [Leptolyngbya foveolarum]|uniref:Undecaprenyl-phosphate alpha-N-acetylglucosaminyl 1-phosphate transferase n=1 Tax=Leptolyngbya foveolarum TaxID=47253 RepID=A0A2W4WA63_9CYAN|nr:MAG: undecaprenyl-phosphate alpha-N-acetylglucosaminyl 1-phosphate transferase [Leptolyngbya foveolarum]
MTIYWIYIAACLLSAGVVLAITPGVKALALRYGKFDLPGDRKVHQRPTVRLGGVAIFSATMLSALCASWGAVTFTSIPASAFHPTLLILLGGSGFFLIGFADDLFQISALNRLIMQFAVAALLWSLGLRIDVWVLPGLSPMAFGWLSLPITALWLSGVANAINWIDGLDGLAAGVAGIATVSLVIFCMAIAQPVPAILGAALIGSLLGFLYYNYNPATIFMGDGGSYFVGFILASLCIVGPQHIDSPFATLLPLVILGVPLVDMVGVILLRLYRKKSPFSADRLHLHHRLLDRDLSHRAAVGVVYVLTLMTSGLAFALAGMIESAIFFAGLSSALVALSWWVRQQILPDESSNIAMSKGI